MTTWRVLGKLNQYKDFACADDTSKPPPTLARRYLLVKRPVGIYLPVPVNTPARRICFKGVKSAKYRGLFAFVGRMGTVIGIVGQ